jgi:hypothetical protein
MIREYRCMKLHPSYYFYLPLASTNYTVQQQGVKFKEKARNTRRYFETWPPVKEDDLSQFLSNHKPNWQKFFPLRIFHPTLETILEEEPQEEEEPDVEYDEDFEEDEDTMRMNDVRGENTTPTKYKDQQLVQEKKHSNPRPIRRRWKTVKRVLRTLCCIPCSKKDKKNRV